MCPNCDEDVSFIIRDAHYQLINNLTEEIEESGELFVDDHELDTVICPEKAGAYILKYIYSVADEVWIDNFKVKVRG